MIRSILLALALAVGVSSAAQAQQVFTVASCSATGVSNAPGTIGRFYAGPDGVLCVSGGGGSGGGGGSPTGSVSAAGSNGSVAQAVQGITGGVPLNGYTGQYNNALPTFANGQVGYVALDVNGRQILSPTVTLPISAGSLPLPTGAASAALQSNVQSAAGTSAGTLLTVQGSSTGVAIPVSGAFFQATQPVSAANLPLPSGAATSANQASEITQLTTIAQRAIYFTDTSGTSVGSSAAYNGTVRDTGVPSPMSRFTAAAYSSQAGTLVAQACLDNACANAIAIASATIPAGGGTTTVTAPLTSRYSRVVFNMGTTAGTVLIFSSFSAN